MTKPYLDKIVKNNLSKKRKYAVAAMLLAALSFGIFEVKKVQESKKTSFSSADESTQHFLKEDNLKNIAPPSLSQRAIKTKGGISYEYTDSKDSQFVQKVKPTLMHFLDNLNKINVSPLDPMMSNISISNICFWGTASGTNCQFIIHDQETSNSWTVIYKQMTNNIYRKNFEGVTYFGLSGQNNPYRAISSPPDKEALKRLAKNRKSDLESGVAQEIITRIMKSLESRPEEYQQRDMVHEKPFGYDIGTYIATYEKKPKLGEKIKDPYNVANIIKIISISPVSESQAVLTHYFDGDAGNN